MSSIPQSKEELKQAIQTTFTKLLEEYHSLPPEHARTVGVDGNVKGTKISPSDTLAYLVGWGQLVLKWYTLKEQGEQVDFPETGYTWNQLGQLATHFHQSYSQREYEGLLTEFEETIQSLLQLIESLDNSALYEHTWYKKWTLGRMIQFNTSSPMKTTRTKIRRFKREYAL